MWRFDGDKDKPWPADEIRERIRRGPASVRSRHGGFEADGQSFRSAVQSYRFGPGPYEYARILAIAQANAYTPSFEQTLGQAKTDTGGRAVQSR